MGLVVAWLYLPNMCIRVFVRWENIMHGRNRAHHIGGIRKIKELHDICQPFFLFKYDVLVSI